MSYIPVPKFAMNDLVKDRMQLTQLVPIGIRDGRVNQYHLQPL